MARREQFSLTQPAIVQKAIELIESEGWESVTVRRLARELGVYPNTLYWHFGAEGASILEAWVSEYLLTKRLAVLTPEMSWQDKIRAIFSARREEVLNHPNLHRHLILSLRGNGKPNVTWVAPLVEAIAESGIDPSRIESVFNALVGGLEGYLSVELAASKTHAALDHQTEHEDRSRVAGDGMLSQLDADRLFILRKLGGRDQPLPDGYFVLLEALISWIESDAGVSNPSHQ